MRTTLDLPDPLFRELKARAAREGKKLKDLVTSYIEAGLFGASSLTETPVRPARSKLPVARRATGRVIPAMSNAEMEQILADEDAGR